MLLELVFTTSPHLFSCLFSELKSHGNELGTYLSIILYLAKLCKGGKLELGARTGLIYQHYRGVTSLNVVAFIRSEAGDVQANFSTAESTVNVEVIEDLLYFVCDNRGEDKVFLRVTDLSGAKTVSTIFFQCLDL